MDPGVFPQLATLYSITNNGNQVLCMALAVKDNYTRLLEAYAVFLTTLLTDPGVNSRKGLHTCILN